jgi:hypothetical protein
VKQIAMRVDADEATVGERVQGSLIGEFFFARFYASSVQFAIHYVDNGGTTAAGVACHEPSMSESVEAVAAAFGTRTMAGGERYGFIKEEEFGVEAGGHHCALSASEA